MDRCFSLPSYSSSGSSEQTASRNLFTVVGPSRQALICTAYGEGPALELRLTYSNGDVLESESFRGDHQAEHLAWMAEVWRLALIQQGFHELPNTLAR
jgi:hypothetical protein